ncbi:MAG: hypothetical protein ACOY90_16210 [Candidatus Zhuqueibacterota bacterium]
MKRIINNFLLVLFVLIGVIIVHALVRYATCPIYKFPEPRPFAGNTWFNPYQDMNPDWFKANFQVQSLSWLGATDGRNRTEDVVEQYKKLGYDIITISDYQYINKMKDMDISFIPVYEHGYNMKKRHQVVIGAKNVLWHEYMFWQNEHHKQNILNLLKEENPFVAIAHPRFMHGYESGNMKILTNYDAIEVLNHYRKSVALWDEALSAGRAVWLIGDDDSHNVHDPNQTGVCWTMINAETTAEKDVLSALKKGQMYGVEGRNAVNDNSLLFASVVENTYRIQLKNPAGQIRFIGQDGKLVSVTENQNYAELNLSQGDTYIRAEIENSGSTMYLNPIFRINGDVISRPAAIIDEPKTTLLRTAIVLFILSLWFGGRFFYFNLYPARSAAYRRPIRIPRPIFAFFRTIQNILRRKLQFGRKNS